MGEKPREEEQPLSPEVKKQLEEMPEPSEEELKKFDHLKKPFIDALRKAGKKEGKPEK